MMARPSILTRSAQRFTSGRSVTMEQTNPATLLETVNLRKSFGGVQAVDSVSMRLRPSETVGIIGPNGSGKSTLFNLLAGFHRATSGQILWDSRDITKLRAHRRPSLGIARTFQEKMCFANLTVRENVQYALLQAGANDLSDAAVGDALDFVRLPRRTMEQNAGDLSWGQLRLLGISLSLPLRPRLLLLDEPFAGLNARAAEPMGELLAALRAEGMAIAIVEHEMSLLLPLCDRVIAFDRGKIVAEASPDEILKHSEVRRAYFGGE